MGKRRFVPTRLLQTGMKVDQSITDRTSRILIARGMLLDPYLIQGLQKLGISGVYIREGEDEIDEKLVSSKDDKPSKETLAKIKELTVEDRSKVILNESVRARAQEGILYLYNDRNSEKFADVAKAVTDDLIKAIDENDAIAVDVNILKISDEYTFQHSVDVAVLSMMIAKKMGLSKEEVYDIGISGLLHDIGKAKIPNEILNKPGRLTEEEFAIIKQHPTYGYEILREKPDLKQSIKLGVLQHHEKIDATGYPLGMEEVQISLFAKIIAVADIYDALVTDRPYKKGFTQRDAVEMIMTMTGELDMAAMKGFLGSVILYPEGSIVELSNGENARVVQNYEEAVLRPKVVGIKSGRIYDLANDIDCASIIIY